jgi:hypothetical protein
MIQTDEPIEAVIISGPRRGEIVCLPGDAVPEVTDEELRLLNNALDDLIAAIDRVSDEVSATTESIRTRVELL